MMIIFSSAVMFCLSLHAKFVRLLDFSRLQQTYQSPSMSTETTHSRPTQPALRIRVRRTPHNSVLQHLVCSCRCSCSCDATAAGEGDGESPSFFELSHLHANVNLQAVLNFLSVQSIKMKIIQVGRAMYMPQSGVPCLQVHAISLSSKIL